MQDGGKTDESTRSFSLAPIPLVYVGHSEHIPQAPDQPPGLKRLVYSEGTGD